MNKYASRELRLTMQSIGQSAIIPPNDYTFPVTVGNFGYGYAILEGSSAMPQGNILMKALTLKSNFADGLVWKHPYSRIITQIKPYVGAIGAWLSTGVCSAPKGSYIITGAGTTWLVDLAVGFQIIIAGVLYTVTAVFDNTHIQVSKATPAAIFGQQVFVKGSTIGITATFTPASKTVTVDSTVGLIAGVWYYCSGQIFKIDTIGVLQFTTFEYPTMAGTGGMANINISGDLSTQYVNFTELNTPIPFDSFATPAIQGIEGADFYLFDTVTYPNGVNTVFLTKSINTAFANDICFFHLELDVECTA